MILTNIPKTMCARNAFSKAKKPKIFARDGPKVNKNEYVHEMGPKKL